MSGPLQIPGLPVEPIAQMPLRRALRRKQIESWGSAQNLSSSGLIGG